MEWGRDGSRQVHKKNGREQEEGPTEMGQGLGGGSRGKGGACGSEVELGEIVGELRGIWETFWQKTE